jgi:hypothetical protein
MTLRPGIQTGGSELQAGASRQNSIPPMGDATRNSTGTTVPSRLGPPTAWILGDAVIVTTAIRCSGEGDPMTTENANLTDVRDMYSVHETFRRGLRDAPGQLAAARDGDTERASRLA